MLFIIIKLLYEFHDSVLLAPGFGIWLGLKDGARVVVLALVSGRARAHERRRRLEKSLDPLGLPRVRVTRLRRRRQYLVRLEDHGRFETLLLVLLVRNDDEVRWPARGLLLAFTMVHAWLVLRLVARSAVFAAELEVMLRKLVVLLADARRRIRLTDILVGLLLMVRLIKLFRGLGVVEVVI